MERYIDADRFVERIKVSPAFRNINDGFWLQRVVLDLLNNMPTADVVPKSEVEELSREYESLAKTVNEGSELIRKLRNKIDEIKKDRYQVLPDGRIELIPRTDIDKIKTEVAREFIEAVDSMMELVCAMTGLEMTFFGKYAELKKKYTEVNDE